jgi:serine/threonine-protein kinase
MSEQHQPPEHTGAFTPVSDPELEPGLAAAFGGPPSLLHALRQQLPQLSAIRLPEPDDRTPLPLTSPGTVESQAPEPGGEPCPVGRPERYQLQREIAHGGMGSVFKGRDADLSRDVAIKLLLDRHAGRPDLVCRFVEEAQIAGQLQHPGIVPVYELGQMNGRPFFAMKLVKGQTLAQLLETRSDPGQDLPRVVQNFEQVCQAVAYAHARGVIHRDLKPANVMVGSFGEVLVMDWGLAKVLRRGGIDDKLASQQLPEAVSEVRTARSGGSTVEAESGTQAGSVLGTPSYMAPEQARGDLDLLDERADVFGLGAILCHILTGKPPFTGRNPEALRKAQTASLTEAFSALDGCGADAELVALAKRCLAAEPWDRPREASAVVDAVGVYQRGVAERLRQAELQRAAAQARAEEEKKRRRLAVGLAAAVLVLVLAGGGSGVWWWQGRQEVVRQVEAALAEADRERQADHWAGVRAALERARGHLGGGGPVMLRDRVEQAWRDADVVAALEEVRLRQWDVRSGRWVNSLADENYAAAFRSYGIEIDASDPEEAAARVRGSAVQDHLLAALDNWWSIRRMMNDREGADRLRAVADQADGDPWRTGLRAAIAANESGRLKDFVGQTSARLPAVLVVLANALRDSGAVAEAEEVLRRGLAQHPANFWLIPELGDLLDKQRRFGEAEGFHRVALALRPDSPAVWTHLGENLWEQEKLSEAVACCRQAIELDAKYAHAHNNLGIALAKQGHLDEAMACFRRTIELEPNHVNALTHLGNVLCLRGKRDEAIACYRRAIQLAPGNADAHSNLGKALWEQGKLDEAAASFRRAIELYPKIGQAHTGLGAVLWQQGKRDEAVVSFRRATEMDPNHLEAYSNLGQALPEVGRFHEALVELEVGHRLGSKSPAWRSRFAEQIKDCRRLVELDNRLPGVLSGTDRPAAAELLGFARVCGLKQRFASAAGLYVEAFAVQPRLAGDLRAYYRYNAACFAARAGCGQGSDASGLTGADRLRWRRQALTWLRHDLAAWDRTAAPDGPAARPVAVQMLRHWQSDPDLTGLRDPAGLARLSAEERAACERLWADVAAVLHRAESKK